MIKKKNLAELMNLETTGSAVRLQHVSSAFRIGLSATSDRGIVKLHT